eukprot:CAMPEP_0197621756 /NCGR_PEP_ID=MMETSP1338-20131121/2234_1 /TAXON_ID=43686 ORGANISM="Pelagodinium beii, Strain RCC1491" /NCGR_SAMPLE_ID=MMETSP1338 /ASSEMBLY_ACC=CAM_ASM_000754 /LENGTH=159 /DNA_ID=CAMNT_0043191293 /DNA_START=84 /DNA_END=563 /DNA_ORIENTATION=-
MATQAEISTTPRTRAALWVSPTRLALAGVAAMSISALMLALDTSTEAPGLLKKDAPMPVPAERPAEWGSVMRREPKATVMPAPTAERPAEWGHLMRREPKVTPPVLAADATPQRTRGGAAMAAVVFGVVAIIGFAQQIRSAMDLLKDSFLGEESKGKAK